MSNRNFDFSAVVKILNAQNNANFYNRQQTVVQRTPGIPYTIDLQSANPQTGNYDADTIATLQAGQQAYYFKGVPDTTVLSPQQYTPISVTTPVVVPILEAPVLTQIIEGNTNLSVEFTQEAGTFTITNYKYSTDGGTTFTTFSPAVTTSPVLITGLNNGPSTPYSVVLQAVSDATTSASSNVLTGSPTASVPTTPVLNYALPNDTSAYIYFTGIAAMNESIQYSVDGGLNYTNLGSSNPELITGLTNGTIVTVQLRTINTFTMVSSTVSNTVTVTPAAPTTAASWLEYDPNNSSSYSSGTTLTNVGTYNGSLSATGTLQNGVTRITGSGIARNVFNLSGSSQYISFGTFNFGSAITVTAWIYPTTKNNINNLIANGPPNSNTPGFKMNWNSYNLTGADGAMVLENGTVGTWALPGTAAGTVIMGQWQHLAYVLDVPNQAALFFRNGQPVPNGYGATVANVTMANRAFNIGAYSGGGFTPKAELGYLKVFDSVLDATQVLADYDNSRASFGL
jgi:hypothetical protein